MTTKQEAARMGEKLEPCPLHMLTEVHLQTAVQALAYLLAFNSVTKQPSAFDAEREAALFVIRDNRAAIVEACNQHSHLLSRCAELEKALREYSHESRLQTFEDRERFRAEARALVGGQS